MNKNANTVLLGVVVVVCMTIKATTITAMPTPRRIRANGHRNKQTSEYRPQMCLRYLSGTFLKLNKKKNAKQLTVDFRFR